jgi:GNAT superfamily N-acetyltransferase
MLDAANYSAVETLRDGRELQIRALRPEDREDFLSAVARAGPRSRYLRFFSSKRDFTEREKGFFLNVDFDKHVALVALMNEAGQKVIVGGGRYIGLDAKKAEAAFMVIDDRQGRGIGSLLMRHLISIARAAGLSALVAEILPDNMPMLEVFEKSGLPIIKTRDAEAVHVELQLT